MPDKNRPRAVTIMVSPQLLEKVLGLAPDVRITGVMHDSISQLITLRLDSPNFPTVIKGAHPPQADLIYDPETKKSAISL